MKKFGVFSGFLGSGKTSTMMALTEYGTDHGIRTAMISNDLSGSGLADHRLARLAGLRAGEITGNCICYVPDQLTALLDRFYDGEGCGLVISDIPGFGVGALEHVYHGLDERCHGKYSLAPFTVLTEPRTVDILKNGGDEPAYILNTQLVEADLIVLNKTDLLSDAERRETEAWLRERYPQAALLSVSARTGEGIPALFRALTEGEASLRRPEIGYGGAEFREAMRNVMEYDLQYHASVCCDSFDGNDYLLELAQAVQTGLRRMEGALLPHLKLLAWEPEGDYGKVDLLGADRPVQVTHRFREPCTELAVALNGSAFCPEEALDELISGAVERVSERFQLERVIFRKQLV